MRTIKYRGISQANDNMVYGDLVINKPTSSHRIIENFALVTNAKYRTGECHEVSGNIHLVNPETVGQFTGLKDKDGEGKEIYHKDLIVNLSRNGGLPHIVEWGEKFGGWIGLYHGLAYLIAQELYEIEVVGNIFENKDLISN